MASSTGRRLSASGKRLTTGTIDQYKCVYKLLEEYEGITTIPLRIKLIHRSSLRELQKEKLYWQRFFRNFTEYLYRKKYYDHYVTLVYKTIKTFFNYLIIEKCLPVGLYHKQFRLPSEKLSPVVLEPEKLKYLILDRLFHDSLSKPLQRAKDIFVFGCTVGLRFGDLMALRKQDIQYTPSGNFITVSTQKTATDVKIPLPSYLQDVINKYKTKAGKYILPRLSNTNMNLAVKKLIEKAGWTYNLPKVRRRQGKAVELKNDKGDCFRFCDHMTTHTMRRTAITTLLMMGVPETMVRTISGHAAGSREFYKYVAVVQNYLDEKVSLAYEKLLNHQ